MRLISAAHKIEDNRRFRSSADDDESLVLKVKLGSDVSGFEDEDAFGYGISKYAHRHFVAHFQNKKNDPSVRPVMVKEVLVTIDSERPECFQLTLCSLF